MPDLQITQVKSLIGSKQDQRATLRGLGLRRIRHTVVQPDRPEIRGMIAKVSHLVEVVEADGTIERPLKKRASETRKASGKISPVEQHVAGLTTTDAPDVPASPGAPASQGTASGGPATGSSGEESTSSAPGTSDPAVGTVQDATDAIGDDQAGSDDAADTSTTGEEES